MKINEMKKILIELNVPKKQTSDVVVYTLLALSGLGEKDKWETCTNEWMRIHDIIEFIKNDYGVAYAENSRETIRKQEIHHFRNAAFIEDNGRATNSPKYMYRLTEEMKNLISNYNSLKWEIVLKDFRMNHKSLIDIYESKKKRKKITATINEELIELSYGKHNELQKRIVEEFAPRFANESICIYLADTIEKDLIKNDVILDELGFDISVHNKMPDVILYSRKRKWMYFIEAVTSVEPINPKRILEINEVTKNILCGKIFVTAFLDFKTYKKFSDELAWETEVWIAELPEHMIHLNGDKFLGPRY